MCSPIPNSSPTLENPLLSLSPRVNHSPPRRQDKFEDFLNSIYCHYDPDPKYLILNGKIESSKVLLLNLMILVDGYFQDPENYTKNSCQIKVELLDKIDDYPDDKPVTVKILARAYSPYSLEDDQGYMIETILDCENPVVAQYISCASFHVTRDWKIFKLPLDYKEEIFKKSTYTDLYKILDVNSGERLIFKTLSEKEYSQLGSKQANKMLKHRFLVIRDLHRDSQSQGFIHMQEPPFTTLDVRLSNGYLATGMVEKFYADGDLFDLLTNPIYENITFFARLQFCQDLAHDLSHLVALGIFHTDIKPDNIMTKEIADGTYKLYIGDYVDSLRFKKIFDAFKNALEKSCVTASDVNFFRHFKYIPTPSYLHIRDWEIITSSLKAIKTIFANSMSDRQNRVSEFQTHIEILMKVSEKHQVFALGNTVYQIFCQCSPYPTPKNSLSCRGGRGNPLHPSSQAYLQTELFKLSPAALPVAKKIPQFVFTMLRDNYEERPRLKTTYKTFRSYLSELTDLTKNPTCIRPNVFSQNSPANLRPKLVASRTN